MVSGVGDYRVAGAEQSPEAADIRLVTGGEHDCVLGLHPLRKLSLKFKVKVDGPVQQTRPCQPGSEPINR